MTARIRGLPIIAALAGLGLAPIAALAEKPEEWGDHPLVPRIQGSEILSYEFREFDEVTLTFGPREDGDYPDARDFEGAHTQLMYILRNPDVSTLQIKRAYVQGLEQAGFEIVFAGSGRGDLGRRFHRFDLFDRSRPSGTSVHEIGRGGEESERRFVAASHTEEDVHLNAFIHPNRRDGSVLKLDVVEVPAEEVTLGVVAPEPATPQPTEPDEIVAAHERQDLSAADIEADLISEGRVAVRDILFEFDSAAIIEDSADALATIAGFLEDSADLELVIVGHTDNVGDFEYNLALSMERAQAVASWLQRRHGIDGDRLQPAGAGMMAPVASNRSDEGRTQNRRVELVER